MSLLRQWDIVLVPYPTADNPHYLVLLSPDHLAGNPDFRNLNGLVCTTIRPPDCPVRSHEVFLDAADEFEHKTACRCHLVIEFAREDSRKCPSLSRHAGSNFLSLPPTAPLEGLVPAPESAHAITALADEAVRCREEGRKRVLVSISAATAARSRRLRHPSVGEDEGQRQRRLRWASHWSLFRA